MLKKLVYDSPYEITFLFAKQKLWKCCIFPIQIKRKNEIIYHRTWSPRRKKK